MDAQSEENSGHEMVVELLNDASMAMDPNEKLDCLRKVQETIIHRVKILFFKEFFDVKGNSLVITCPHILYSWKIYMYILCFAENKHISNFLVNVLCNKIVNSQLL